MYCILVAGMPASGKSTIAARLSDTMGIPMLSKDSIKEILYDDLGFKSREEKVQLGVAAMHMLYYAAEQMMKAGKGFILENNFEDISIPDLNRLLEKYEYTGITVRLTGDPAVIYKRFAARDGSAERHPGHVVNDCYPVVGRVSNHHQKTYEQYLKDIEERGFCRFAANGPVIEVDVTDLDKLDYTSLVEEIQSRCQQLK